MGIDEEVMKYKIVVPIVAVVVIVASVFAYTYFSMPRSTTITLNGAGATFPEPFLNATITAYTSQVGTDVQINYRGVGSGEGVQLLTDKEVDFAGSDAALADWQRAGAPGLLHIPESIGAVALVYNLPNIPSGLQLSGEVIADIFLGTITNWTDPAITEINLLIPTDLPPIAITTVHRCDSSGTTDVFTRYLSNVSLKWNSTVGFGTSVNWLGSNAITASGNANVASIVNQTKYTIGYVELAYALQNNMTMASIENPAGYGNYVAPSLYSTTKAVQSVASTLPAGNQSWYNVSLFNAPNPEAYPIVSFTYLLVYKELNVIPGMDQKKATDLVQYLWYVIHDGQTLANPLSYASLPMNVVTIDETTIWSMTFNGQSLPVG